MKQKRILFLGLASLVLAMAACGGKAAPAAGSTFSGAIKVGAKAGSGTISFRVSENGSSITGVDITLQELNCGGLAIGSIHDNLGEALISMSNGGFSASIPAMGRGQMTESRNYNLSTSPFDFPAFSDMANVGKFEGKFTSATHASGTIDIYIWAVMTDRACELGKFTWDAESP